MFFKGNSHLRCGLGQQGLLTGNFVFWSTKEKTKPAKQLAAEPSAGYIFLPF